MNKEVKQGAPPPPPAGPPPAKAKAGVKAAVKDFSKAGVKAMMLD